MGNLSIKQIANVLITGILVSFLMFIMLEVLFAHFINNLIIGVMEDTSILMIIILGLELIMLGISIIVGVMVAQNIKKISVLKASLMAYICNMLFLIILSYLSLFALYPEVFSEVSGFEIILILPQVLVYFALYVLKQVLLLFLLSVVSYYVLFVIFLNQFHEYRNYQKFKSNNHQSW